jgi:hypothetical protein
MTTRKQGEPAASSDAGEFDPSKPLDDSRYADAPLGKESERGEFATDRPIDNDHDIEARNAEGPVGGFRANASGTQTPTAGTSVRASVDGPSITRADAEKLEAAAIVVDSFNGLHRRIAEIERLIGIENDDRTKATIVELTPSGGLRG